MVDSRIAEPSLSGLHQVSPRSLGVVGELAVDGSINSTSCGLWKCSLLARGDADPRPEAATDLA